MSILVVYDSYFGNTEKIAFKIGEILGENVPVIRPDNFEIDSLSKLELLVVGAPTRAFRPSDAIKSFLKNIPDNSLKGVKVAAFDTRMDPNDVGNPILKIMVNLFGYAAKSIAKKLVKKGGNLIGEPAGFVVLGSEGPLRDNEFEKVSKWANTLLDIAHA
jgi:flavodoxin